jgi:signal transduction histidine kinase
MAEKAAAQLEELPVGGAGEDAEPLDPIILAVRNRGLRAFRALGTIMGVVSLTALLPAVTSADPRAGLSFAVVLAVAFGLASWLIPARKHQLAAGFMVGTVAILAVLGVWIIGPSFTMGSLFVLVPVLAIFFFGRGVAVPVAVLTALVLAALGVACWALGRTEVGTVPGAAVPYPVYLKLALTTFGSVLIAVAVVHATLEAVDRAIRRAHEAADRERAAHGQRIAAERALSRSKELEAIGQLASGVAHDTRNALLVLSAGVKELRATVHGEEGRSVLDDLDHAVAGVTGTVQQLLSLGKRQAAGARAVPLEAELHHFASALRRVIPPEVELHVECRSRAQAELDPVQLEQALLNLALNARDAMPEGGLLTLRLHDVVHAGRRHAVLEIEDSGIGIEPATAARMFEPFFTTKGAGTGLGLHMVRTFVSQAGGEIEVDSAVGRGTRIRLSFPAVGLAAV